jgi:hypothetical protein
LNKTFFMKKLKLMLLSFALLTVAGGALAFKAILCEEYCTALPNAAGNCTISVGVNKFCPTRQNATAEGGVERIPLCYTTDDSDGNFDCKINGVTPVCITTSTLLATGCAERSR